MSSEMLPFAQGQRFFTFLLKTLSLRGARVGLRVGSDVAIARYAFSFVSKFVPGLDLRSFLNFVSLTNLPLAR